jgi:uncharacterized RDD family membrane protein YckC
MSNQYGGPWSSQPEGAVPGSQQSGWAQPGPSDPAGPYPPGGAGGVPPGVDTAPGQPQPGPYPPGQSGFAPQPGYPSGPPGSAPPVGYAIPLRTDYASWGKRVGAMLIDQILTYVGLIIFSIGYGFWIASIARSTGSYVDLSGGATWFIVGTVIMLAGMVWNVYNRWFVAGRTGQSLGKRVTKIKLIGEPTDAPIGPMNAFLRDLVHTVDGMAYVGYLWPLWDDKKQTFSDKIMRTIVVNAS